MANTGTETIFSVKRKIDRVKIIKTKRVSVKGNFFMARN